MTQQSRVGNCGRASPAGAESEMLPGAYRRTSRRPTSPRVQRAGRSTGRRRARPPSSEDDDLDERPGRRGGVVVGPSSVDDVERARPRSPGRVRRPTRGTGSATRAASHRRSRTPRAEHGSLPARHRRRPGGRRHGSPIPAGLPGHPAVAVATSAFPRRRARTAAERRGQGGASEKPVRARTRARGASELEADGARRRRSPSGAAGSRIDHFLRRRAAAARFRSASRSR